MKRNDGHFDSSRRTLGRGRAGAGVSIAARDLGDIREFGDDIVLCVNNLSRFPQPVELDLRRFEGWTPIELTGRVEFPQIGVLPYMLTLAGHGFYWFELARARFEGRPRPGRGGTGAGAPTSAVAESLLASGVVHSGEEDDERRPLRTRRPTAREDPR